MREGAGRRVALRVDVYIELVLRAGDPALDALGADGEGPVAHLGEGGGGRCGAGGRRAEMRVAGDPASNLALE